MLLSELDGFSTQRIFMFQRCIGCKRELPAQISWNPTFLKNKNLKTSLLSHNRRLTLQAVLSQWERFDSPLCKYLWDLGAGDCQKNSPDVEVSRQVGADPFSIKGQRSSGVVETCALFISFLLLARAPILREFTCQLVNFLFLFNL